MGLGHGGEGEIPRIRAMRDGRITVVCRITGVCATHKIRLNNSHDGQENEQRRVHRAEQAFMKPTLNKHSYVVSLNKHS
jgi:hypothetical protein